MHHQNAAAIDDDDTRQGQHQKNQSASNVSQPLLSLSQQLDHHTTLDHLQKQERS